MSIVAILLIVLSLIGLFAARMAQMHAFKLLNELRGTNHGGWRCFVAVSIGMTELTHAFFLGAICLIIADAIMSDRENPPPSKGSNEGAYKPAPAAIHQ